MNQPEFQEILDEAFEASGIDEHAKNALIKSWIQLINAIPALMRLCAESFQKTPRKVFCNSVFFEDDD